MQSYDEINLNEKDKTKQVWVSVTGIEVSACMSACLDRKF